MSVNPAHVLDGGIPALSQVGRHGAASDEHRYVPEG